MGFFGDSPEIRGAAAKASRQIQKSVDPHRTLDGVDLGPRGDMKEARRRYERENPSRIRWLFKIGEWISRHT